MIFGEEGSGSQQNRQPQQQQQQLRVDVSRMDTIYANFFALAGSPEELTLYLATNSSIPGAQEPILTVTHRLMMLPSKAKQLMMLLQQAVKAHEDRFGPIELAPQQRNNPKGP